MDNLTYLSNNSSEYIENLYQAYQEEIGRGEPLIEMIEQTQPAVEYSDVWNDPYFIVE